MTTEMSATHPERFFYQKRVDVNLETFKPERAMWIVFDRFMKTAAHFHGRLSESPFECWSKSGQLPDGSFKGLWFAAGGIELHYKSPRYEGHQPIESCGVSGGKCYPDGTSLGADRFVRWWTGDDATAFGEVRSWLTRDEGEAQ